MSGFGHSDDLYSVNSNSGKEFNLLKINSLIDWNLLEFTYPLEKEGLSENSNALKTHIAITILSYNFHNSDTAKVLEIINNTNHKKHIPYINFALKNTASQEVNPGILDSLISSLENSELTALYDINKKLLVTRDNVEMHNIINTTRFEAVL